MQFAKIIDDKGRQIAKPKACEGSVSWDATSGQAHAWAVDGKTCIAEMRNARVIWVGSAGMRLEGHEPIDMEATRFRLMQWQLIFSKDQGKQGGLK